MRFPTTLVFLHIGHAAKGLLLLPNLTGPYHVGTVTVEMVDYARVDIEAPTPQPRHLMTSLFYPTYSRRGYPLARYYPPGTAAYENEEFGLAPGTAQSIITQSYLNAPVTKSDAPVVLFSPGLGSMRLEYQSLLEDLASYGYIILAVDHPYQTRLVEYPDGRLVFSNETSGYPGDEVGLDIRVADMRFALDALRNNTILRAIPGLDQEFKKPPLETNRVGSFGHSFGGAASLQLLVNDSRVVSAVNMDGGQFGSVVRVGTDKPAVLFASEGHNITGVASWAAMWPNLRGFKRNVIFNGTTHGSFTDYPFFRDALGSSFPPQYRDWFGTIGGLRMQAIEVVYLDAFFSKYLKGDDSKFRLFSDPRKYPEITLEF